MKTYAEKLKELIEQNKVILEQYQITGDYICVVDGSHQIVIKVLEIFEDGFYGHFANSEKAKVLCPTMVVVPLEDKVINAVFFGQGKENVN
jgi:hypothetical protein